MKKVLIAFVSVGLILTACGKKHVAVSTTTQVTAPPDYGPPMPLTGQHQPKAEIRDRPAIILKVDNSPDGRPQGNIDKSDLIFEERVEGGLSRFIVVFQTYDASYAGPIRSVRSSDPPIVDPLHGLFGYSGGIPVFIQALHRADVVDVGFDALTSAYQRKPNGHPYEHTLYADTNKIRASSLAAKGSAPPNFFNFLGDGEGFAAAGARAVAGASFTLGHETGDFQWDAASKIWLRSTDGAPHMVDSNGTLVRLGVENVIFQYVNYTNTGQKDVAGSEVDQVNSIGTGTGTALVDGQAVDINWSKADSGAVTTYTDSSGAALKLTPGRTWVVFVPSGGPKIQTR